MAEDRAQEGKAEWVNMTFPPRWVRRYVLTDKDGMDWEKAYCAIPPGTMANGIDLGGYTLDAFMTDRMRGQVANGEPVTVGIRLDEGPDTKVTLWKGSGSDRRTIDVRPIVLAKALKEGRAGYKARASQADGRQAEGVDIDEALMGLGPRYGDPAEDARGADPKARGEGGRGLSDMRAEAAASAAEKNGGAGRARGGQELMA